jgi:hypothetical protein
VESYGEGMGGLGERSQLVEELEGVSYFNLIWLSLSIIRKS